MKKTPPQVSATLKTSYGPPFCTVTVRESNEEPAIAHFFVTARQGGLQTFELSMGQFATLLEVVNDVAKHRLKWPNAGKPRPAKKED
jgi:hypothetical protein